jgi:hypothetical protein
MKTISTRHESGAVSIFVVIFAALLMTVVTVSFIRIMVNDQNQATNNDLAQSAYDSAQAGVEDAKRSLLRYLSVCENDGSAACSLLGTQIQAVSEECNSALRIGGVIDPSGIGEVPVQQSTSTDDQLLDQAYTCVKVDLETNDYVGTLAANQSKLIPLQGTDTFDRVTIEWFSREDIGEASADSSVSLSALPSPKPLLAEESWPTNRPSLLRASLMQFGNSFTLDDFDYTSAGQSNANTVFLYPTAGVASATQSFITRDIRANSPGASTPADTSGNSPTAVRCEPNLASGGYACSVTMILPEPVGGGDRTAYLRLTPLYNESHFRVTMSDGGTAVQFDGVQPEIDATGRANDLFRRVATRVDLIDTSFPYPEAALDVLGSLCKNFAVTDSTYIDGSTSCTP